MIKQIKIKDKIKEETKKEKKDLFKSEGQLAVDIFETDENFVVITAIAGVLAEEIDISTEKDMLIIKGNREKPTDPPGKKNYFFQECYWGPFSRKIILPENVDTSRIEAQMNNGILTIKLPKIQTEKKREINVTEKG